MLSYCGHKFCHKFTALSFSCTVTFVDKEEGQPSIGFRYAKKKQSPVPSAPNMFASHVGKEQGQTPPTPRHPPPSSIPMRPCSPHTPALRGSQ